MAAPTDKPDTDQPDVDKKGAGPATTAAERANPASTRSADFGIDTTAKTTSEAIRGYLSGCATATSGRCPRCSGWPRCSSCSPRWTRAVPSRAC